MLGALLMHYPKKAKRWVLAGVPLCTLGQGLQIYLVNMHGARAAKALVGVGRGLYQITVRVCIQAVVDWDDVAVAAGVFFASMNLGGVIGTRYVACEP